MPEGLLAGGDDLKQQIALLEQQIAAMKQQGRPQQQGMSGLLGGGTSAPSMPPEQLQQIYGLLAGGADDPAAVGQQYVSARQNQQDIDQRGQLNQPFDKLLQVYGSVNPYDFETPSLAAFHKNLMTTGNFDFNLLDRKEDLSTKEQGFLSEAINTVHKTESDMGRMADLSNRFDEMGARGELKGRLGGGLNEWLKGVLGSEDAVSQLRTEYEQLRTTNVIQNLPPGVASDKDIEIVMRGWPSGVADPQYIARFLRGMRKMSAIKHAQSTHGARYLSVHQTQQGQLEDWDKNRDWLVRDALSRVGVSPEKGGAPFGGLAGNKPRSDDDIKKAYGVE